MSHQSMSEKLALARAIVARHRYRAPVKRIEQQHLDTAHLVSAELDRVKGAVKRGLAALQAHRDKAVLLVTVTGAAIALAPDAMARDITLSTGEAGLMIWGAIALGFFLGVLWVACVGDRT